MSDRLKFMPARVKTAVRPRLAILLVHGMGVGPDWWYPIASSLRRFRVTVRALKMPSLETAGPAAWCVAILRELPRGPAILVGHSLGAAMLPHIVWWRYHETDYIPSNSLLLLASPLGMPQECGLVPRVGNLPPNGTTSASADVQFV